MRVRREEFAHRVGGGGRGVKKQLGNDPLEDNRVVAQGRLYEGRGRATRARQIKIDPARHAVRGSGWALGRGGRCALCKLTVARRGWVKEDTGKVRWERNGEHRAGTS